MMKSLAIRSVRVIDGTGRTIERATVVIRGATIAAVGSDRDISLPRGTIKIDGRGLTLLPGLIDCHVHLCLGASRTSSERSPKRRPRSHCSNRARRRGNPWRQASPPCATWDHATTPSLRCNGLSTQGLSPDLALSRQVWRFA